MNKFKSIVSVLAVAVLMAGCSYSNEIPGRSFTYKKGDLEFHCKKETAKREIKIDLEKLKDIVPFTQSIDDPVEEATNICKKFLTD